MGKEYKFDAKDYELNLIYKYYQYLVHQHKKHGQGALLIELLYFYIHQLQQNEFETFSDQI